MTYPKKPTELEAKISAALKYTAADIEPSPEAEERFAAGLAKARAQKVGRALAADNHFVIRLSKKMVFALCILFCMTAGTSFAAGRIAGWSGHNLPWTETQCFADVKKDLLPQLEFEPNIVEAFANGYTFDRGGLGVNQAMDENHVSVGKIYTDLQLRYTRPGTAGRLNLYVSNAPEERDNTDYKAERQIGDMTMYYSQDVYRFVPPDYQMTEEDIALEESGAVTFSYGSIEVEENVFSGVVWRQDGVRYHLFGFDLPLSADELFDMAMEVVYADQPVEFAYAE